jgi:hypothetical protein
MHKFIHTNKDIYTYTHQNICIHTSASGGISKRVIRSKRPNTYPDPPLIDNPTRPLPTDITP